MLENETENTGSSSRSFVKSSEKYEDLNSSGITLVITSIIGYAFLILKALDIIPLYFTGFSEYLFYIVMGGMFTAFLIIGIMTLKKAVRVRSQIDTEENTTHRIIEFFTENYTKERIDEEIDATSLSEGELYYNQYDYIKNIIQSNFDNIDDSFADHLVEEIYQKLYEES